jgi:proteasome assembly chaperone (PAC2) family protein
MTDGLVWERHPDLRRPLMVAAFAGWNDAGDAATGAADWLIRQHDPVRIAAIDPDEHIDYQSHRPQVELVGGVTRSVAWPANEYFEVNCAERDLVVLRGIEPNVRWKSFCRAVIAVASETGCETVVTLGALLGDVPHTRPVRLTGTASNSQLMDELELARSEYEGPTGIVGVLHDQCAASGLRTASLWAPVPHYVASPPNPPATKALLERFAQLAELDLDLHGLDQLVDLWRVQVDHAIRDDDDVRNYVRELEGRVDAEDASERGIVLGGHPAGGGSVPDADELAAEVEQFLRDQDDDG